MTHVMNFTEQNIFIDNEVKQYQVEVITFDGDSEMVYVEATSAEEAQMLAVQEVENADYTMVQSCI